METWFGEQYYLYIWIPGTALGCLAGLTGALAGVFAPRGRMRGLVYALCALIMGGSAVMLVAAIVAKLGGQPYGIWYGLGLPGCIGIFVMGFNFPVVRRVYANAEMRRLQARDG